MANDYSVAANGQIFERHIQDNHTIAAASAVSDNATGQKLERPPRNDPFLPDTILREGARGNTVRVLRDRLQYLHENEDNFDIVSPIPSRRFASEDEHYAQIWRSLESYLNNGIRFYPRDEGQPLEHPGGNIVNMDVWESLGLSVGNTWQQMFGSIDAGGPTIHMRLQGSLATLTWRPRFRIARTTVGVTHFSGVLSSDDPLYKAIVKESLNRVFRWASHHQNESGGLTNRLGRRGGVSEDLEIQGATGRFFVIIRDVNGRRYRPGDDVDGYNFQARNWNDSNVYIPITRDMSHAWVLDATAWSYNRNLRMTIHQHPDNFRLTRADERKISEVEGEIGSLERKIERLRESGDSWLESTINELQTRLGERKDEHWRLNNKIINNVKRLAWVVEHEFGHVVGLFDQYDYTEHSRILGIAFPGVPSSVYGHRQYIWNVERGIRSIMMIPSAHAIRTAQDYEMILFAFRDNALQNYVEQNPSGALGAATAIAAPAATIINPPMAAVTALVSIPVTAPLIESLTPKSQVFYHSGRYRYE